MFASIRQKNSTIATICVYYVVGDRVVVAVKCQSNPSIRPIRCDVVSDRVVVRLIHHTDLIEFAVRYIVVLERVVVRKRHVNAVCSI